MLIDPTAQMVFLTIFAVALAAGTALLLVVLGHGLVVARRERLARHETIPTYYGRLHFTH